MTYAELTVAWLNWLKDYSVEQTLPTMVKLAEAQINRRLAKAGISGARERTAATLASEFVGAPADVLALESMILATGEIVENSTLDGIEALRQIEGSGTAQTGKPRFFTMTGGEIRLYPVPDQSYSATLVYQAKPLGLGPTNSSNWVSVDHPGVYLYGVLTHAAPYIGDDTRLATWSAQFEAALDDLVATERAKRGSRSTPGFRADLSFGRANTFNIITGS